MLWYKMELMHVEVLVILVCAGLATISLVVGLWKLYVTFHKEGEKHRPFFMEGSKKKEPMPPALIKEMADRAMRNKKMASTISCRKYCDTSCSCDTLEECRYDPKNFPKWDGQVTPLMYVAAVGICIMVLFSLFKK